MGSEKLAEEAAGAFAADKALEAVDPNAGFLAKAAAGIAGFEGAGALGDMLTKHEDAADQPAAEAPAEDAPTDQASDEQNG